MPDITPKLSEIMDCLYRVAVKAVIIQNGKLLVVQESEGWYGLPGGGLEYNETFRATLYREIQEELGVQIQTLEADDNPAFVTNEGIVEEVPRFTLYYRVRLKTIPHIAKGSGELTHRWINKAEFVSLYLQPNVRPARQFLLSLLYPGRN